MKYIRRIVLLLLTLIALVGCNNITEISFVSNDTYYVGDSLEVQPTSSNGQSTTATVTSSNENIATANGYTVTFIAAGEVEITITSNKNKALMYSKVITVTENPYEGITGIYFDIDEYYLLTDIVEINVLAQPMNILMNSCELVSSDTSIAIFTNNSIHFLKTGSVYISAYDELSDLSYMKEITVVSAMPTSVDVVIDDVYYTNSLSNVDLQVTPFEATDQITWDIHPHNVCSYEDGKLILGDSGSATIEIKSKIDGSVLYTKTIQVIESNQFIVNEDYTSGTIVYENREYVYGETAYSTVQDAINHSSSGIEILITQEDINELFNINRNDISLYGLNKNVSGDGERNAETTIYSKIVVNYNTENIIINGFAFTNNGQIEFSGKNDNVNISNNYFYDSSLNSEAFVVSESYEDGIIQFNDTSKMSDNIVIENNYFSNIDQVGINYQDVQNIKVLNNKFEDFDCDAVRSTDTTPTNNSQWVFKDNSFINGKYNGLMFMSYGSAPEIGLVQFLSIYNNYFENVGTYDDLLSNAISFNNYNEGVTNINISYNTLKHCDNYILLRNNAISSNQLNFFGYVNYNKFLGEPNSFYIKNKNVTDTEVTNKKQIMLSNNFFGDESGNSLTPQDSMFEGVIYNSDIIVNGNVLDNISHMYGPNISYIGAKCQMTSYEDVIWSTSDSDKATISSTGLVSCLSDGNVKITATNSNGYQTYLDLIIAKKCSIDYAALLISVAMQEEGYREKSDGYSKYGGWYAEQVNNSVYATGDWCAMFVSWCANQAGISTNTILRYASVSAGYSWFEAKGLFEYKENYTPKPGDILIFKSDGASHTGIVVKVEGNTLYTIEGNTSDMVAQRNYDLTNCSRLTGYGTPDYSGYNESNMTFDVSGSTPGEGLSTK